MERFGRFVLEERLAEGGMAEVFRAVSEGAAGVQKVVALKRVLPALGGIPDFVTMFIDEARIAASLTHINIAQVFEFGEVNGVYFLVMELIEGVDLGRLMAAGKARGARLPATVASFVAAEVARGLAYAHAKVGPDGEPLGLVHRDVSPQNVLLSFAGEVKLADFGIAKAAGKVHKTESGAVMGKLRYMSPEQVLGQPLDGRSDVFALGVVLWEALSGRQLFDGQHPGQVADQVKQAKVPSASLPGVPPALEGLCRATLARLPADRPTAAELARGLGELAGAGVGREDLAALMRDWIGPSPKRVAVVDGGATKAGHAKARKRATGLVATVIALGALGGVGLFVWRPWVAVDEPSHLMFSVDAGVVGSDGGAVVDRAATALAAFEAVPRSEVAWRGVAAADYLALLSSLDARLCGGEPDSPELARQKLEPVRDGLLAYVAALGQLPPRVASALASFLRDRPAFRPGPDGWTLSWLATMVEPTEPKHLLDLLRQRRNHWPGRDDAADGGVACSAAATVRRLAVLDGARAEGLVRYLESPARETSVDVDGFRYQVLGAVRDEAAATLEVQLRVTNLGASARPLQLHHLRLAELERGPTVEPAIDSLAAGQLIEARLTFGEVTDRVAEATSLTLPNQHHLAVYAELLP